MLESYQMNTNSFASVMRDRLKKSNPSKYSKSSFLLKDIIILKKHYKNEIPPPSINDAEEFARIIERYTNQENEWKNNHSEPTSAADYQFDTNETQPKKPKLQNPYQYPQFFPLPFSPAFYPFPYQLQYHHQSRHPFNYLLHLYSQLIQIYIVQIQYPHAPYRLMRTIATHLKTTNCICLQVQHQSRALLNQMGTIVI